MPASTSPTEKEEEKKKKKKVNEACADTPSNTSSTLPATIMPLISPHALLYSGLAQKPPTRPSGREPSQCRSISINTSSLSNANGSTLIKIGQTAAVCGVRAEVLPVEQIAGYGVGRNTRRERTRYQRSREEEKEGEGERNGEDDDDDDDAIIRDHNLLVPNLELATGCSPFHLPGSPPSQEAQSLSQRLLSLLHTSRLVRLSDLCIYDEQSSTAADLQRQFPDDAVKKEPTRKRATLKAFWVLYIDTIIINHDGNIFDACVLAIFSALRDTLLPRAWWDAELESVMCSPRRDQARRLSLRGCPLSMSFAVFSSNKLEDRGGENGRVVKQVLCDPDAFEEGCCQERGCVTVDVDQGGKVWVVKMEKYGGGIVARGGLRDMVHRAAERWKEWQLVLAQEARLGYEDKA